MDINSEFIPQKEKLNLPLCTGISQQGTICTRTVVYMDCKCQSHSNFRNDASMKIAHLHLNNRLVRSKFEQLAIESAAFRNQQGARVQKEPKTINSLRPILRKPEEQHPSGSKLAEEIKRQFQNSRKL